MKLKKIVSGVAFNAYSRVGAERYAEAQRKEGYSARIFPRTVRAGGAHVDVFVVVTYSVAKEQRA